MKGILLRRWKPKTSLQRADGTHWPLCRHLGLRVSHLNRHSGDTAGVRWEEWPAQSEEKQTYQGQQNSLDRSRTLQVGKTGVSNESLIIFYRHFGYFSLGALTTLLFTELAKYQIGRLRPHYLSLCNPDLTDDLCKDNGYYKFVEEDEEIMCRGYEEHKKELHEARLSFLSGHSSFSFYCGTFLIIYLQARLNKMPYIQRTPIRLVYRVLKVMRPFIQFAMIILSFWVSLTRISDYFHHPMDVVTGALVGVGFALVTLTIIADLFNKRSSFWKSSCGPSWNLSNHANPTATGVALTERTISPSRN